MKKKIKETNHLWGVEMFKLQVSENSWFCQSKLQRLRKWCSGRLRWHYKRVSLPPSAIVEAAETHPGQHHERIRKGLSGLMAIPQRWRLDPQRRMSHTSRHFHCEYFLPRLSHYFFTTHTKRYFSLNLPQVSLFFQKFLQVCVKQN